MALPANIRLARIKKELGDLQLRPPWGITCRLEKEDELDVLNISMKGPKDTPYVGGTFHLLVNLSERYPLEHPLVKFITPVYHPNIDKGGRICMDLLKMPPNGGWVPAVTLANLLIGIQSLLANPNPDDPLMIDIANEFKNDREKFNQNAKVYTEKHAILIKEKAENDNIARDDDPKAVKRTIPNSSSKLGLKLRKVEVDVNKASSASTSNS